MIAFREEVDGAIPNVTQFLPIRPGVAWAFETRLTR
jgi:hypothetical protein